MRPKLRAMPKNNPADSQPKLLHIFRPGAWTAQSGERIEFSAADLAATAQAFNPQISKAPLVLGHPATDDQAMGWVSSLSANTRGLFAQPVQVLPAFAQAVTDGRYGTVSSKFYRPTDSKNPVPGVWYLAHVGFLGAASPAVKGLDPPAFTTEDDLVTFEEGVSLPPDMASDLFGTAAQPTPAFTEPQPEEPTVTPEEKAALEAENTRLRGELATIRADAINTANVAFCERLVGLPTEARAVLVQTFNHFDALAEPLEFGEGETKAPLAAQLKAVLVALPALVQFGESATRKRAADAPAATADDVQFADISNPERLVQHKAIKAHMAEHKTDYAAAARAVLHS